MKNSDAIQVYQKECWKNYKKQVGISGNYTYLYGNPVKVHVPVDVAEHGLMIIGAYPTAHFNTIGSEKDVPVCDHLYPFSNEIYFDGSRIRTVDSGRELEDLFLKPLNNLSRSQTWITDLVKVFLFKEGHKEKYRRLGFSGELVDRNEFMYLAKKSECFIKQEIELCQPKVILGLGAEVNEVLLKMSKEKATKTIASCQQQEYKVNGVSYPYFACPHPGILMREKEDNNKWKIVLEQILEKVKRLL